MSSVVSSLRIAVGVLLVCAAVDMISVAVAGMPPIQSLPTAKQEVLIDPNDPNAGSDPNADPNAGSDSVGHPGAASGAATSTTVPADPALISSGRQLYQGLCQKCHGVNMVSPGGSFFDLRTFPPDSQPRFIKSVTEGKRSMPAWGSVLKPADLQALWAYVVTGGKSP